MVVYDLPYFKYFLVKQSQLSYILHVLFVAIVLLLCTSSECSRFL